jgi:DNA polymerase III subunit delta
MARNSPGRHTVGYRELKAEIRAGIIRSLYVLYGEENFLIDKLIESIEQAVIAPGCLALDRVALDGACQSPRLEPDKLQAEVMTPPFLSSRKLVITRYSGWLSPAGMARRGQNSPALAEADESNGSRTDDDEHDEEESTPGAGSAKTRLERLANILEHLPDSACLVMVEHKVDRRQKNLINLIEQKGVLAEIGREEPGVLQQWVSAECKRHEMKISELASQSLIDRCDCSMDMIWNELNKIFLYCQYAACREIDLPLIEKISLPDLRGSIFDLTDALSEGRTERALTLVDNLISQKEPVQLIQFMLARHLRQLICAAELGRADRIVSELKVMPFVASRLATQARRLPPQILEDLYGRCVETDTQVKTGRITDRLALETLLAEIAAMFRKMQSH